MSTAITPAPVADPAPLAIATHQVRGPLAFLTDTNAFNHLWRISTGYSRSALVPQQFRGHVEDCFIICQLAIRMNVDPFMPMQSTYVVHGKPGFEAKLAIALLNASGKIKGTLKCSFEGNGESYGARAWAIDAETGEKITGPKVDWKLVKAEGWNVDKPLRDGKGVQKSKWNTMPDLMFQYRAATFFIRTNYPEVLMGMQTTEEIADTAVQIGTLPVNVVDGRLVDNLLSEDTPQAAAPETDTDPPFSPPTAAEQAEHAEPAKTDTTAQDDEDIVFTEWCAEIDRLATEHTPAEATNAINLQLKRAGKPTSGLTGRLVKRIEDYAGRVKAKLGK